VEGAEVLAARYRGRGGARPGPRLFRIDKAKQVELGIELLDAIETGIDNLDGRERAVRNSPGNLGCRREADVAQVRSSALGSAPK
jgi:hypothetical protein